MESRTVTATQAAPCARLHKECIDVRNYFKVDPIGDILGNPAQMLGAIEEGIQWSQGNALLQEAARFYWQRKPDVEDRTIAAQKKVNLLDTDGSKDVAGIYLIRTRLGNWEALLRDAQDKMAVNA